MVMKTTKARVSALQELILEKHPYDTPEFVMLNIAAGAQKYLAWLNDSCATR